MVLQLLHLHRPPRHCAGQQGGIERDITAANGALEKTTFTFINDRRLEWAVLDWNEMAVGVYDRLGAEAMDDWTLRRLGGDALEALARKAEH